ncbi:MAG: alpha/beta fold hydrolase [Actinomycetota bacterium]|nr:alpha/beta fold hydrolase [Actinomycetota bacterium]
MQSRTLTIRGVPMRWEESGTGAAVVLLHGIPTSPALWRRVVPLIREGRCLAFEMVGYGDSIPTGRERDLSLGHQTDYLLAWLDALDIERAVLVGHDLGGGIAHIAAVRAPARCAGLVLTNAVGYDSWPIPSVRMLRAGSIVLRLLPAPTVYGVMGSLMVRGHEALAMARESLRLHAGPYLRHDGTAALARQVSWLHARDTLEVAGRIRELDVPARVVWGAADQFQKVAYGERFAWDLGAELRRIEGGRHFVPEDHPEALAAAVDDVLRAA